ncbi:MAG: glycerophosphodiester phosphodiesterase [Acidimicrobiia bacterium]|nr:glycerophosphodiester phosphodiesterase [Acidimicrobiia bacterium]
MPAVIPPLLDPPIGFAHRGARAHERENTLEAFHLAARLGATGIESDVWMSRDGQAVLDHDGVVGPRWRRRPLAEFDRAELPDHMPLLAELYTEVGTDLPVSLDVKDAAAADEVVAVARRFGAAGQLWLCHPDLTTLIEWRERYPDVRLVDSTRHHRIEEGPERRAADLAAAGIDAINLRHDDWKAGLVALFHRFGVLAFGWDAQFERHMDELLDMGIDAIYSDHVDRMMARLNDRY